jgi:hypothetical protein
MWDGTHGMVALKEAQAETMLERETTENFLTLA